MKSKARFLPFVMALALLTSLFVFSSATAATGKVTLDSSYITFPGGELEITVEDADLNTGVVETEDMALNPRGAGANVRFQIPSGDYVARDVIRFRTQRSPIQSASPADLDLDPEAADPPSQEYHDIVLTPDTQGDDYTTWAFKENWEALTSPAAEVVPDGQFPLGLAHPFELTNAGGGVFILQAESDFNVGSPGINFSVTYKAPDVQTAEVIISSTQDTDGVRVLLTETGADTGKFTGSFRTESNTFSIIDLNGGVEESLVNVDLNGDGEIGDNTESSGREEIDRLDQDGEPLLDRNGNRIHMFRDLNGDGELPPSGTTTPAGKPVPFLDVKLVSGARMPDGDMKVGRLISLSGYEATADPVQAAEPAQKVIYWSDGTITTPNERTGITLEARQQAEIDEIEMLRDGLVAETGRSLQTLPDTEFSGDSLIRKGLPTIAVNAGALITVTYDDDGTKRRATATVETTPPTVTVISPAHGSATRVRSVRLIVEATDTDSGIDEDQLDLDSADLGTDFDYSEDHPFVVEVNAVGGGTANGQPDVTLLTPVNGGFRVETQLEQIPTGEHYVDWKAIVRDNAGNVAQSDQDPTDVDSAPEPDLYRIRIDTVPPSLGSATIEFNPGADASMKTVEGAITGNHLDDDGEVEENAAEADPTWIRVIFNEPVDESSLLASDFRVNSVAPADIAFSSKVSSSVFLKVPTLGSNARPAVELVGEISDTAGNSRPGGLRVEAARDGIAPTLTVASSPDYHQSEVTIDVRADEPLLTAPSILLNDSEENSDDLQGSGLAVTRLVTTDHYRTAFEAPSAQQPMIYNIRVLAKDAAGNPARAVGKAKAGDDDAIQFEIDNQLPSPTSVTFPGIAAGDESYDTDSPNEITTQNPFITIEWAAEAMEYARITHVVGTGDDQTMTSTLSNDIDGDVADAKADGKEDDNDADYYVVTNLDTHGTVDVTDLVIGGHAVATPSGDETSARTDIAATDDAGAITFSATKPTKNQLLISARGLALGTYEMTFNGVDELGNTLESDVKLAFEVKEPDPFEIKLRPGWNLVSLPATPQSTAIDDVIPADHPASTVVAYDPTQLGAWLTATRGDDGTFASGLTTLTHITGSTAFWIFTDSFDSLNVSLMQQSGGTVATLPTVNLVAGWNLLPILDVSGGKKFGDDIEDSANYVTGDLRTYTYDSSSDRYSPLGDNALEIGRGYWVYMNETKVLVP